MPWPYRNRRRPRKGEQTRLTRSPMPGSMNITSLVSNGTVNVTINFDAAVQPGTLLASTGLTITGKTVTGIGHMSGSQAIAVCTATVAAGVAWANTTALLVRGSKGQGAAAGSGVTL